MCESQVDEKKLNEMIGYYSMLMVRDSKIVINSEEVENVLARLYHHNNEHAMDWLGGEKKVGNFLEVLHSLK